MTDYSALQRTLIQRGQTDLAALADAFELVRQSNDRAANMEIRRIALSHALKGSSDGDELYRKTLIFAAPYDFDSFMLWNEIRRQQKDQYWLPRRTKLRHICQALQDMEDGKLDELFLAMPPRTGKSSLIMFFMVWIMLRDSERSNLYCSYTQKVVDVFYKGILEVLTDKVTYSWHEIFPNSKVVETNAMDDLINLDRKKRYSTFTGRSLYGTLNGACDCNGYVIGDDLHSGIEESLSIDRLNTAWDHIENNLIPRAKEGARKIWEGTRWSIKDAYSRRLELLQNDPAYKNVRWKSINTPALNENEESNFEYLFGVGFSTDHFLKRRASYERNNDMASWLAQYQGEPIERNGAVFNPEDLRYYNGVLPEAQPDRVFIAIDPSWGGGDFTAGPVVFQYGDDLFIHDVVYTNGDKRVSQPEIVHAAMKYNASAIIVEATKTTAGYTEDIDQLMRDNGRRINVQSSISHWINSRNKDVKGKEQRIFDNAPEIRERMIFLAEGKRSKTYSLFMQNLFSFTMTGRNKTDDACDSLCIAIFAAFTSSNRVQVFQSPF